MNAVKMRIPTPSFFQPLDARPASEAQLHQPMDAVLFAVVTALLLATSVMGAALAMRSHVNLAVLHDRAPLFVMVLA